MRGLSVREQAKRINEEAIELIEGVMQKHTAAMLEAMKEKVAEQREKARALACELAASQAREAKLRLALNDIPLGYLPKEDPVVVAARAALHQPADDTALSELITKAGEVMRERCVKELNRLDYWYSAMAIRQLPDVTLDDLKGEAK